MGANKLQHRHLGSRAKVLSPVAWLLVIGMIAAACGGEEKPAGREAPTGPPEKADLTVFVANVPQFLPVYVAQSKGFFQKYGLTVDLPTFEGGAGRATEAAISGEADIGYTSWPLAFRLATEGQYLKFLWSIAYYRRYEGVDYSAHRLVVVENSPIQSVKDLGGKKIAVLARGSNEEAILRFILKQVGVDPGSVELVEAFWADHPALLESGQVDAAYMIYPFLACCIPNGQETGGGLRSIGDPFLGGDHGIPEVFGDEGAAMVGPTVANEKFVAENPNTVRAFVFAVRDSIDWIKDNPKEALDIIIAQTGSSVEVQVNSPPHLFAKWLDQQAPMQRLVQMLIDAGFLDSAPDLARFQSGLPYSEKDMVTNGVNLVPWNPAEIASP